MDNSQKNVNSGKALRLLNIVGVGREHAQALNPVWSRTVVSDLSLKPRADDLKDVIVKTRGAAEVVAAMPNH